MLVLPIAAVAVAALVTLPDARAHERYNDGCNQCHGSFTGGVSPAGTVFPQNSKHQMHRSSSFMGTNCNLCHSSGDNDNPFIGMSNGTANNPGVGCTGCHGRDYGGSVGNSGVGLRAHHASAGITLCAGCHPNDPAPLPENVWPTYYGTSDTNATDPCNAAPGFGESWSVGDTRGLDNDGDDLYDGDDPDCETCLDLDLDGVTDCDGDCDDADPNTWPGAPELCDGVDNDCDGVVPPDELTDADGDGAPACADCDESDAAVFPGAPELCDGIDNDCDGIVPADEVDDDGDGFAECDGDCDDADGAVFPGAPEICDGVDNDCNGVADDDPGCGCPDDDGDGVSTCDGDCDDADPAVYPGAPELCDGIDNDCDGIVPGDEIDDDGDGFAECDGDCDDGQAGVNPEGVEICDGLDNDCNGAADDGLDCTAACDVTCYADPVGDDEPDEDHRELLIGFEAAQDCGVVEAVVDIGCELIPVTAGQLVDLECEDDDDDHCEFEFEDDGTLEIRAFQAVLVVTATAPDGTVTQCSTDLCDPGDSGGGGCPGDVDGDGGVGIDDLLAVLLGWGPHPGGHPADLDGNGMVDADDLVTVVTGWGGCG
jgi:hypothetical protein